MGSLINPLIVFLATTAWGALHSWLASFTTKRLVRQILGPWIDRYYRLIFVLLAVASLVPILALVAFLPSRVLWVIPFPWQLLTIGVQFLALVLLVATALETDVMAFAGIRQVLYPNVPFEEKLVFNGFYQFVRHPIYLFTIVLFWLFPYMTDLTLAFFLAGTLYFMIGTIPEERKLVAVYGETYRQYRREVPRLIPRFIKKKK